MGQNHIENYYNVTPEDNVFTIEGLFMQLIKTTCFQAFYFRCGEPKVSLEMHEREPQIQATCLCNADFEGKTSVDVTLDIAFYY